MVGRFGAGAVTAREASPRFDVYTQTIAPTSETVRTPQLVISTYVRKLGARGGRETKSAKTGAPGGAGELVRKRATAGEPYYPTMQSARAWRFFFLLK